MIINYNGTKFSIDIFDEMGDTHFNSTIAASFIHVLVDAAVINTNVLYRKINLLENEFIVIKKSSVIILLKNA